MMKPFHNKIPRARLYIKGGVLLKALLKLPLISVKRTEIAHRFEETLAKSFAVKYAHTVSSCRMAFYFVLKSLGLKPGDEVLLSPLTIPDMVNAIHVLGLRPVFVDMTLEAHSISISDILAKITPKSKAVLITHLSGLVPDMGKIKKIADEHKLLLIEDVSQNQGASFEGRLLGSFGQAAVLTTSIAKTMSSLWGGAILTNDPKINQDVRKYSSEMLKPATKKFLFKMILDNLKVIFATNRLMFSFFTYYAFWGLSKIFPDKVCQIHDKPRAEGHFFENPRILRSSMPDDVLFEFSDLQSEILLDGLNRVPAVIEKRTRLADAFFKHLSVNSRALFSFSTKATHKDTHWHLPIMVPVKRLDFQLFMLNRYIDTTGYGLALCSTEPVFAPYSTETPCAEYIKKNTVFIPIHDSFNESQMIFMSQVVNDFVEKHWSELKNELFIESEKGLDHRGGVRSWTSAQS